MTTTMHREFIGAGQYSREIRNGHKSYDENCNNSRCDIIGTPRELHPRVQKYFQRVQNAGGRK